jgi:hypothetical protein
MMTRKDTSNKKKNNNNIDNSYMHIYEAEMSEWKEQIVGVDEQEAREALHNWLMRYHPEAKVDRFYLKEENAWT